MVYDKFRTCATKCCSYRTTKKGEYVTVVTPTKVDPFDMFKLSYN